MLEDLCLKLVKGGARAIFEKIHIRGEEEHAFHIYYTTYYHPLGREPPIRVGTLLSERIIQSSFIGIEGNYVEHLQVHPSLSIFTSKLPLIQPITSICSISTINRYKRMTLSLIT